jgi:hypothetical protein
MSLQDTPNTYFKFGCPFELSIGVGLRPTAAAQTHILVLRMRAAVTSSSFLK